MKAFIEVKGEIKVDKKEMENVFAGKSCAEGGIACVNKVAATAQRESTSSVVVIVDDLKWT